MVECSHGNAAPSQIVDALSECQAGEGRHKCAVCAYAMGKEAGQRRRFSGPMQTCDKGHAEAPLDMLRALPDSQAGPHRHRCAYEAYQHGKSAGENLADSRHQENEEVDALAEDVEVAKILGDDAIPSTQREQVVLARRGQGAFRQNVLSRCNRCLLTGIDDQRMLVASHIKPWRLSSNAERLDGFNGLILSPHIDHLFDKGWISFSNDGKVIQSSDMPGSIIKEWGIAQTIQHFTFEANHYPYLDFHRSEILRS